VLQEQGQLSVRVQQQLAIGLEYWRMERLICGALLRGCDGGGAGGAGGDKCEGGGSGADEGAGAGAGAGAVAAYRLTEADARRTLESKSFDYRLLHLLLFQLRDAPVDEAAVDCLWFSEVLIEIGDDLVDYEDDVLKGSFNIYRCYVRLFGAEAPMRMVAYVSQVEALYQARFARLPGSVQAAYKARCKQAMRQPGSGNWTMPPPIHDEAAYRNAVLLSTKPAAEPDEGPFQTPARPV
jgi:hypothetical protein